MGFRRTSIKGLIEFLQILYPLKSFSSEEILYFLIFTGAIRGTYMKNVFTFIYEKGCHLCI